jgi:outer membrane receptor protein involved in Fe transport
MVNLQYQFSPRTMAYVAVSRGYKAGGFDARSNRPPPNGTFEFEDERATAWEAGVKGESANGRSQGSLTAFVTDYKDLQTSAFDSRIGFNVGNGSAIVRGIEFNGRWRPVRSLNLSASMALLDFEWTKYNGQCSFGQAPTADDGINCDYKGKTNQLAPEMTGTLSAEHTQLIGSFKLISTLDVARSSSYLESLNLDPNARQDAFIKLNARIGFGDIADRWQVALIGRNLTDEQTVGYAATRRSHRPCSGPAATTASWIRPAALPSRRGYASDPGDWRQRCNRSLAPVSSSSNSVSLSRFRRSPVFRS